MSHRLVEVLEHGWDLVVKCPACGHAEERSKPHFLGVWLKYLNADIDEMGKRISCPACKVRGVEVLVRGATYAHFGMAHDYFKNRAILIYNTLVDAGLDPADYGYDGRPRQGER